MRWLLLSLVLVACGPTDILLDGRSVSSLSVAAERAVSGSVIELTGDHDGPLVFEDGVRVVGDATIRMPASTNGRLIHGLGDLAMDGLTLVGGSSDDGSVLRVERNLDLTDIDFNAGIGEIGVFAGGSVQASGGTWSHDGDALRVRAPFGRPPEVNLQDLSVTGTLDVPADQVTIARVTGSPTVLSTSQQLTILDSHLLVLDTRGPSHQITLTDVDAALFVRSGDANLLAVNSPFLQAFTGDLGLVDVNADVLIATADQADLAAVHSTDLSVVSTGELRADTIDASTVQLVGDTLFATEITAEQLTLSGVGTSRGITVDGPNASALFQFGTFQEVVVRSTAEPVRLELQAVAVENLVLIEPPTAEAAVLIKSQSYGNVKWMSFLGGSRASWSDPTTLFRVERSLVEMQSLQGFNLGLYFDDSAGIMNDGVDPVQFQFRFQDPGFLGNQDPRLEADAPYPFWGAFAGPNGAATQARFEAL